jgi:hypothetical protein
MGKEGRWSSPWSSTTPSIGVLCSGLRAAVLFVRSGGWEEAVMLLFTLARAQREGLGAGWKMELSHG